MASGYDVAKSGNKMATPYKLDNNRRKTNSTMPSGWRPVSSLSRKTNPPLRWHADAREKLRVVVAIAVYDAPSDYKLL